MPDMNKKEDRELWFSMFTSLLGSITSTPNPGNLITSKITFVTTDPTAVERKFKDKNPFTITATPEEREAAIKELFEAVQAGKVFMPGSDGDMMKITSINDGNSLNPERFTEPMKPSGNAFVKWFKRTMNSINKKWFKDDIDAENNYEKNKEHFDNVSAEFDKDEYKISGEDLKKEKDQRVKDENTRHRQVIKTTELNKIPDFNSPEHQKVNDSYSKQIDDLAKSDPDALKEMELYVATEFLSNPKYSDEQKQSFLQGVEKYSSATRFIVSDKQRDFLSQREAFFKDSANAGKKFSLVDQRNAQTTVKEINRLVTQETNLSHVHAQAAHLGQMLDDKFGPDLCTTGGASKGQRQYLKSLQEMSKIYKDGLEAEIKILSGTAKISEIKDLAAKFAAKEALNTYLEEEAREQRGNERVGGQGPLETNFWKMTQTESGRFNAEQFTAQMSLSATVKELQNKTPEQARNDLGSLTETGINKYKEVKSQVVSAVNKRSAATKQFRENTKTFTEATKDSFSMGNPH